VLETVRTFIVWGGSLAVGWQSFEYVQLVGFIVAIAGKPNADRPCHPLPVLHGVSC
jgi:hypothetical protein